jgi:dsDNA-binding SOS-regulon protein
MLLRDFFVEGYREVESKFVSGGADINSVKKTLDQFRELVNKNQVKGNERNIDWWGKNHSYAEFDKWVKSLHATPTRSQIKRSQVVGKSINLHEDNDWLVVIPLDKNASCFHGKQTSWCTTKPAQSHFEEYFYRREIILIYCINKHTGAKWAVAAHRDLEKIEMFDQQDNSISARDFKTATGMDPHYLVELAFDNHHDTVQHSRAEFKNKNKELAAMLDAWLYNSVAKQDKKIENLIIYLKDNKQAFNYVDTLVHNNISVDELPTEILTLATGYTWAVIKMLKNPGDVVLERAVYGGQQNAMEYIIDNVKFPPSDRTIISFLTPEEPGDDIQDLVEFLRSYNINLSEQVITHSLKHNIGYTLAFMRSGFSVPAVYQLKFAQQYLEIEGNYISDYDARLFRHSSDDVKYEILKSHPSALDQFPNPSKKLRVVAYRGNPLLVMHTAFFGKFPDIDEQRALWEGGFDESRTRAAIHSVMRNLEGRLVWYNDQIVTKKDQLADKRSKIKILEREFKKEADPVLKRIIDELNDGIEGINEEIESTLAQREIYKTRVDSLNSGIEKIGYHFSEFK